MVERWFRWYDGTVRDGKMRIIAETAEVPVATIVGVWAALLEDASMNDPRGIATKGIKWHSLYLELAEPFLGTVWDTMEELAMVRRNGDVLVIVNWDKRQFETDAKDPTAKQRKDKWKQRHNKDGTDRNAQERSGTVLERSGTPETESETESEREGEKKERKTDAAVPAAEADDPLDSAEDRFWKLVPKLSAGGIAKSRCCQLLKLSDNDFEAVNRILADVLKAHVPSQYLGKIIANLKQERQLEVPMAHDPTLPDFAQGFKRDGYRIEYLRENRWKIGAEIYNEKGEVVGW